MSCSDAGALFSAQFYTWHTPVPWYWAERCISRPVVTK